jgi:hypothetical protein
MLAVLKLIAGAAIAFCIVSPNSAPRADKCECEAKTNSIQNLPRADKCECEVKE